MLVIINDCGSEAMRDREEVSELIGLIYDAALAPETWPVALAKVCAYVRGCAAMVFWQDRALQTGRRVFSWGDDPGYTESYFSDYIKISPVFALQHLAPVGEVCTVGDLVPINELRGTRFYKEWMVPQGYCDNIFSLLDYSSTNYATFAVARSEREGFADDACRQRMRVIVPHVRRAALIGGLLDCAKVRAAELQALLDGLSAGIFLLDANATVLHANAAGQLLLKPSRRLSRRAERFSTNDPRFDRDVQAFCAQAAVSRDAVGANGLAVPLHDEAGAAIHIGRLLPLSSGARSHLETDGAVAALFVAPASTTLDAPLALVASLYKLTRRELQVLHGVLEVGAVPEVAANLGLAQRTVKSHLHRIFDKTGVRRQVDLAKLVAGMTSPTVSAASETARSAEPDPAAPLPRHRG
jgi:DNA-binding CsgD family transcriptional regulator